MFVCTLAIFSTIIILTVMESWPSFQYKLQVPSGSHGQFNVAMENHRFLTVGKSSFLSSI